MNDSSKHEKYQQCLSGAIVKKCLQKSAEHATYLFFSVRSQEDQHNFKIYIYRNKGEFTGLQQFPICK